MSHRKIPAGFDAVRFARKRHFGVVHLRVADGAGGARKTPAVFEQRMCDAEADSVGRSRDDGDGLLSCFHDDSAAGESLKRLTGDLPKCYRESMQSLHERYENVRRRTRQIFDLIAPEAFDMRPIPLRHPLRFYEGHLASFNSGMLLQSSFVKNDPQPELTKFFARGVDPLDTSAADKLTIRQWPERARVADYIAGVDNEMTRAFEWEIDPIYLHTAVEHEEMHQETLMYLIHRVPYDLKRKPATIGSERGKNLSSASWIQMEAGIAELGADPREVPFGWDNEFPKMRVEVAAFEIAARKTSNGDFLEFVQGGGYEDQRLWTEGGWKIHPGVEG
jgi:DinB superfamily